MLNKEHLREEGLRKIVAIKASMNRGLSDDLKTAFKDVVPVIRPIVENINIYDPSWLAGFVSGEGCFYVYIGESSTHKPKESVTLYFTLTQHTGDELLMRNIMEYFGCGKIYKSKESFRYRVTKLLDIETKIIPFFKKYPILGVKSKDFADFCKVVALVKDGKHLTREGMNEIHKIKAKMNTGRIFD